MGNPNRSQNIHIAPLERLSDVNKDTIKLLEKYKMDMSIRELSLKTVYQYVSDINQWLLYVLVHQDNKPVTEIEEDDLTKFFYFCKQAGNNSRRNKRRMASISAFYKFLRKKKLVTENPMEFMDRPKKDTDIYTQTFLNNEQVELMRQKLSETGNIQLKLYAILSLSTMGRVNAVAHLRWDQVDYAERIFTDVLEKEGKKVILYFSEEVSDLISELQKYRECNEIDDNGWVFYTPAQNKTKDGAISTSTLTDWAHKIGEMIGIPELHPHDFRHSGSQLMMLSGAPIELISELLNHEGLDVTKKHYLRQDRKKTKSEKDKYQF